MALVAETEYLVSCCWRGTPHTLWNPNTATSKFWAGLHSLCRCFDSLFRFFGASKRLQMLIYNLLASLQSIRECHLSVDHYGKQLRGLGWFFPKRSRP